ncbi:unnamed protein product [Blumeria hordei]|uniref:Mutator-like element protein n=2 Tax=Blumeria hordei TaxID=2867405 RepID=A0A383UJ24_BLUHO|nr:hypothetical protein BGHDH14_bgh00241 [Blumeria hordei DH14]SZE99561.1 unnamed protein product [Blumeria hordei]
MSMTPQDSARNNFIAGPSQHVFRVHTNIPNNASTSQPRNFGRPGMGVLRPHTQQVTYTGPYASNPATRPNLNSTTSAEQQIAQGVLSNPPISTNSNTPQRRPPPLVSGIHISNNGTPQNQPISTSRPLSSSTGLNQSQRQQRQSQNSSPALQQLNVQRQSMNSSPVNGMGSRPSEGPDEESQDLSMIDPQLGLDQQLDPNNAMINQGTSDVPTITQGEMLSPPPGGSFPTFEALFAFAQAHALAHGYAFVIGRSKRDNRGLKKVFLICDRGGTNKEKVHGEQRQRKTKSRKCGCEFGVFGLENKTAWLLRGRIDGEHLMHNHPPSESPTEHPGARKLDPKAIAAVKALEENGVSVKETLEILHRENPTVRYLPRDIYNARAAIKRDPSRVEATAMEELPTFYKKPPMTFEEKLRAELRTEVANAQAEVEKTKEAWRKEVEELKDQLRNKEKMIQKFEMFIDICNERVMVQRERLAEGEAEGSGADRG